MSEQDGTQSSTKQRRSHRTSTANQGNGKQAPAAQHPTNNDKDAWKAYWKQQGQEWRTEPEIDIDRQKYLAERREIKCDIKLGVYPFKDISLSRADVEWLLATHESHGMSGPVDWSDESQKQREGLDLRGADLREVDLSSLPLARMIAGIFIEGEEFMEDQLEASSCHIEKANFKLAHLEGANFNNAHLEKANFANAYLEAADFAAAHLEEAHLSSVHLERASFIWAHLERAGLSSAQLEGADFRLAHLEGAIVQGTHLESADLGEAHLEGAYLQTTHLEGANLSGAFFDSTTRLNGITLYNKKHGAAILVDIHWNDVNIAVIDWSTISVLGDERKAWRQDHDYPFGGRGIHYPYAMRANRQLAVVLRNQGLNEEAARFAYRAQLMQRVVFRGQSKYRPYLFSLFLDLLAGYGYKPGRSFIAYILVISIFATIYHLLGSHLAWNEAIVISMTAFHGRGFFPDQFHPGDPQALVAAIEAFVGLLIEVTFIATLTQRLFGK